MASRRLYLSMVLMRLLSMASSAPQTACPPPLILSVYSSPSRSSSSSESRRSPSNVAGTLRSLISLCLASRPPRRCQRGGTARQEEAVVFFFDDAADGFRTRQQALLQRQQAPSQQQASSLLQHHPPLSPMASHALRVNCRAGRLCRGCSGAGGGTSSGAGVRISYRLPQLLLLPSPPRLLRKRASRFEQPQQLRVDRIALLLERRGALARDRVALRSAPSSVDARLRSDALPGVGGGGGGGGGFEGGGVTVSGLMPARSNFSHRLILSSLLAAHSTTAGLIESSARTRPLLRSERAGRKEKIPPRLQHLKSRAVRPASRRRRAGPAGLALRADF